MESEFVKVCPFCGQGLSLGDLLAHADVEAIGMMFSAEPFVDAMYYFNHICPGCGTTFAVPIEAFRHLIPEPIPDQLLAGSSECDGHCTRLRDLADCDNPCNNAPYRRFLIGVLNRKATPHKRTA